MIVRDAPEPCDLTADAWAQLEAHAWPGNVRELENEVVRALALAEPGQPLARQHFSERLGTSFAPIANLPSRRTRTKRFARPSTEWSAGWCGTRFGATAGIGSAPRTRSGSREKVSTRS